MVCQRCRGLLVRDAFYDLSVKADARYATTRCINCGHIEDPVLRANRVRDSQSRQGTPCGRIEKGDVECTKIHPEGLASLS